MLFGVIVLVSCFKGPGSRREPPIKKEGIKKRGIKYSAMEK